MESVKGSLQIVRATINGPFKSQEPWQIITITTTTVLISVWLYDFIFQSEPITERLKRLFFKYITLIPSVKRKIDKEMKSIQTMMKEDVHVKTQHLNYILTLPDTGLTNDRIFSIIQSNLNLTSYKWKEGKVSGAIYHSSPELYSLVKEIYGKTSYTNPLHVDVFPGICKMESEVIQMTLDIFNGDANTCGMVTSGGTESILMACKAYRDYANAEKGISRPQIVLPTTAHPAFDKAADYFKITLRRVPIDPVTMQVDLNAMRKTINWNTILLVGSAPNFPYGTMDDIASISDLGLKYNIPVHVDGCLGGFLTPFMCDAGYPIPICDFRLQGVTSISADTHKYGFTPKGSSVVMYREEKYRHYQYSVATDWPGGVYGSPSVNGSRPGGSIAVCWATLLSFGKEGYIEATRNIIHTARYIEKGLRGIKEIFIFGQPATSVIAIGSTHFDVYCLSTELAALGWNLNALQFPSGLHFCVTHVHTQQGVADNFITDVKKCVKKIMQDPKKPVEGKMAIYGTSQHIPDRTLVVKFIKYFLDLMYYIPKPSEQSK